MEQNNSTTELLFDFAPNEIGNNFAVTKGGDNFSGYEEEENEEQEETIIENEDQEEIENPALKENEEGDEYEEEEEEEDDSEDDGEEPKYGDLSGSAVLAKHYIKEGLLPEDFEIPNDLSAKDLASKIKEHYIDNSVLERELKLKEEGLDDDTLEYARLLAAGGDPNTIRSHNVYTRFAEWEIDEDNEEDNITYIKYYFKDKGIDDDYIDTLVDNLTLDGKVVSEANKAKAHFQKKSEQVFKEEKERVTREKEENAKRIAENEKKFTDLIDSGNIGDIKLTPDEAKKFKRDFLNPTEIYKDPQGNVHRVTKYRKKMIELEKDPVRTLELVHLILNGTDKVKQSIKSEVTDDLLSTLDSRTVKKVKKKEKRGNAPWIGSLDTTRLL